MTLDIDFKITAQSEAVDYDDLMKILHRAIDDDFLMYFSSGVRPYNCNSVTDKAEVLYDMSKNIIYWTSDHKYILIRSELGGYGTYAIPNLISDIDPKCKEDWERDVEETDMSDDEFEDGTAFFTEDYFRQKAKKQGL